MSHGRPNDRNRHLGDLGNIRSYGGLTNIYIEDKMITLDPEDQKSIFNRTIVIHRDPDRFKGDSGNAGPSIACGIIQKGKICNEKPC